MVLTRSGAALLALPSPPAPSLTPSQRIFPKCCVPTGDPFPQELSRREKPSIQGPSGASSANWVEHSSVNAHRMNQGADDRPVDLSKLEVLREGAGVLCC